MGLTAVKRFQLVRCYFGVVHALQERLNPRIILSPEVIRDCVNQYIYVNDSVYSNEQERDTDGASDTVPGIVPAQIAELGLIQPIFEVLVNQRLYEELKDLSL